MQKYGLPYHIEHTEDFSVALGPEVPFNSHREGQMAFTVQDEAADQNAA